MRVFHYTSGAWIGHILAAGYIRTSRQERIAGRKPSVWLSTDEAWEHGAGQPTPLEHARRYIGAYRIEVRPEAAPLTWATYRAAYPHRDHDGTEFLAERLGIDIGLWRASFEPIPHEAWLGVDVYCDPGLREWCMLGVPEVHASGWVRTDAELLLDEWQTMMREAGVS